MERACTKMYSCSNLKLKLSISLYLQFETVWWWKCDEMYFFQLYNYNIETIKIMAMAPYTVKSILNQYLSVYG